MTETATRSPEAITEDVRSLLAWDSQVEAAGITVTTDAEGVVTLDGTVPSYTERKRAELDAHMIRGVTSVDNRLLVTAPGNVIPACDEELAVRIRNMLSWATSLDTSRVHVAVEEGTVMLTGSVDSYWQRVRAGDVAGGFSGVTHVDNRLAVAPSASITDHDIERDIRRSLDRDAVIDARGIEVGVSGGIATLSGTVPDYRSFKSAHDIANYTRGVIGVDNRLLIR